MGITNDLDNILPELTKASEAPSLSELERMLPEQLKDEMAKRYKAADFHSDGSLKRVYIIQNPSFLALQSGISYPNPRPHIRRQKPQLIASTRKEIDQLRNQAKVSETKAVKEPSEWLGVIVAGFVAVSLVKTVV